jgi:hypothetical protein
MKVILTYITDEECEELEYEGCVELSIDRDYTEYTIMPQGHGRLISANELDKRRIDYVMSGNAESVKDCAEFAMMIITAPTVFSFPDDIPRTFPLLDRPCSVCKNYSKKFNKCTYKECEIERINIIDKGKMIHKTKDPAEQNE